MIREALRGHTVRDIRDEQSTAQTSCSQEERGQGAEHSKAVNWNVTPATSWQRRTSNFDLKEVLELLINLCVPDDEVAEFASASHEKQWGGGTGGRQCMMAVIRACTRVANHRRANRASLQFLFLRLVEDVAVILGKCLVAEV